MSTDPEVAATESQDPNDLSLSSSIYSTRMDDWWVITGTVIDLPTDLPPRRPVGTNNLILCADTIRVNYTGEEQIIFTEWDNVIVVCKNTQQYGNHHFHREKAVLDDSEEQFRLMFFSETLEQIPPDSRWFTLVVPEEVGLRLRYDKRVDYTEVVITHRFATPTRRAMTTSHFQHRIPAPDSFLVRLLVAAQHMIDEQRTDDAGRFLDLLESILALDNGAPSWQEMAPQVAATREVLQSQLAGSNRVPDLSPSVYAGVAEAYGPALRAFADEFRQFNDYKANIEQRRGAAERILSKEADIIRFQNLVIEQLTENLQRANCNVRKAEAAIKRQNGRVEEAAATFNTNLEAWQRRQERQAAMAIARAAFSFVAGVAKMLTGNPAGAADAAEAVEATAKAATKLDKLVELMKKIAKIVEKVAKIVALSQKLAQAIRRFPNAKRFADSMAEVRREAESSADDAPSDGAYWDQLWVEVEKALAPAAAIRGADDYLKELKIMIIYGRALTNAQAAIPPIIQEIARATLLTKLAEEQHDSVEREIEALQLENPVSPMTSVTLWLNHRSVQRIMLSALQDFDAAHRYWALQVTQRERDTGNSHTQVANDLQAIADLRGQFQAALNSFSPRPQNFYNRGFTLPEEEVADLLRDGRFTLNFTPDFGPFRGWGNIGRVRVHEIAVWVIWENGKRPEHGEMEFTIRTSGDYYDQRVVSGRVRPFRFTLAPLNFTFRYDPAVEGRNPDHRERSIRVSAKIADDFRSFYTEPTLFTQWQFALPGYGDGPIDVEAFQGDDDSEDPCRGLEEFTSKSGDDDAINLEALQGAVKGIRLEFSGSFIRDANRFVEDEPEN